jgi:hypothetical protein
VDEVEYLSETYHAGEIVPAGTYMRIDDGSRRLVELEQAGPLPPGFDGHVAIYLRSAPRLGPSAEIAIHEPAIIHTQPQQ